MAGASGSTRLSLDGMASSLHDGATAVVWPLQQLQHVTGKDGATLQVSLRRLVVPRKHLMDATRRNREGFAVAYPLRLWCLWLE